MHSAILFCNSKRPNVSSPFYWKGMFIITATYTLFLVEAETRNMCLKTFKAPSTNESDGFFLMSATCIYMYNIIMLLYETEHTFLLTTTLPRGANVWFWYQCLIIISVVGRGLLHGKSVQKIANNHNCMHGYSGYNYTDLSKFGQNCSDDRSYLCHIVLWL